MKTGRVIGVNVRERYEFPNEKSGVPQTYGARRGVIMATGGFSRNTGSVCSRTLSLTAVLTRQTTWAPLAKAC